MKLSSIFCSSALQEALSLFSNLTFTRSPTAMAAPLSPSVPLRDVLIVGAGPSGLAAATGLARQLYTAVVFDSGVYRNARTEHMHNVPTWDHRNPKEFRAKAREDLLARYNTIHFENTTVESIHRTPKGCFEATDERGRTWSGRKLILATGVRDIFPEIENYSDVWANGV
jgi:thioredoxin reductase